MKEVPLIHYSSSYFTCAAVTLYHDETKTKSDAREEEDKVVPPTPAQKKTNIVNPKVKSGNIKEDKKVPQTPARKKTNVYPTFTPALGTGRMTRAIPLSGHPKKTKIPPGIGLDQIQSPANLRPKTRCAARTPDSDGVGQRLDELEANKKTDKGKGTSKAKKFTTPSKALESNDESSEIPLKQASRATRSKSIVSKKGSALFDEKFPRRWMAWAWEWIGRAGRMGRMRDFGEGSEGRERLRKER